MVLNPIKLSGLMKPFLRGSAVRVPSIDTHGLIHTFLVKDVSTGKHLCITTIKLLQTNAALFRIHQTFCFIHTFLMKQVITSEADIFSTVTWLGTNGASTLIWNYFSHPSYLMI